MNVRRITPRILSIDLVVGGKVVIVISVYTSWSGRRDNDIDSFYDDLSPEIAFC